MCGVRNAFKLLRNCSMYVTQLSDLFHLKDGSRMEKKKKEKK